MEAPNASSAATGRILMMTMMMMMMGMRMVGGSETTEIYWAYNLFGVFFCTNKRQNIKLYFLNTNPQIMYKDIKCKCNPDHCGILTTIDQHWHGFHKKTCDKRNKMKWKMTVWGITCGFTHSISICSSVHMLSTSTSIRMSIGITLSISSSASMFIYSCTKHQHKHQH